MAASLATLLAVSSFAGAGTAAPAATSKTSSALGKIAVTCAIDLHAVKPPRTLTAENFGTIDCSPFFGSGVQHDSSTVTPTGQLSGHFTGPVKQLFDAGTLSGHFTIDYVTNPQTLAVTYNGTIAIEDGTGLYSGATGTGTLTGGSPDAIRSTITETLTLTRL
ncbi:MAG TPA: hypothetical protein VHZ31_05380 [Solirubrobacteraceae bacterium]|nr:hypothetical protein [Solirubrobacteraceae bacterium]